VYKECIKCKATIHISLFHFDNKSQDGYTNYCKNCKKKYDKLRTKAYGFSSTRKRYGLTKEQFNKLLELQNHKCAICGTNRPYKNNNNAWLVDHDHLTGHVRGLLCFNCNTGIGSLQDSKEIVRKALEYLQNNGVAMSKEMRIKLAFDAID